MDEISKPKVGAVAMMDEHDTQKGKYMTFKSGEEYLVFRRLVPV